jgi:hypothetical protein
MELRHPTTTPGRSDLRMSVGQNTLINPSCSTMTSNYFYCNDILRKNHAFLVVHAQKYPLLFLVDAEPILLAIVSGVGWCFRAYQIRFLSG